MVRHSNHLGAYLTAARSYLTLGKEEKRQPRDPGLPFFGNQQQGRDATKSYRKVLSLGKVWGSALAAGDLEFLRSADLLPKSRCTETRASLLRLKS